MVDFSKHIKGEKEAMAKNKQVDDPFTDDDWGPEMPGATDGGSDEMPEPSSESRPDWLKPHMLGGATTGTLQLTGVSGATEFSDVVLLVTFRGKPCRIGLKTFSKEYKALTKRFGSKKGDWKGQLQYKVIDRGNSPSYIAVR